MPEQRPFELSSAELELRLEEMVDATFSDLVSEFLLMPLGKGFIRYEDFREAYEVLKTHTQAFESFSANVISSALLENSRVLGVLRAILGMTAPEWAELAHSELDSDVTQNAARTLDRKCREDKGYVRSVSERYQAKVDRTHQRGLVPPNHPKSWRELGHLSKLQFNS